MSLFNFVLYFKHTRKKKLQLFKLMVFFNTFNCSFLKTKSYDKSYLLKIIQTIY